MNTTFNTQVQQQSGDFTLKHFVIIILYLCCHWFEAGRAQLEKFDVTHFYAPLSRLLI